MSPAPSILLLLAICLPLAACKSERTVGETRTLDPIRQKFAGNYQMERDESGMVKVKSDRRSQFESKIFKGTSDAKVDKEFQTGKFQTKEYKTGKFQGNKEFATKEAPDAAKEARWNWPWKNGKQAAREAGQAYDTGDAFPTDSARESGRTFATRESPDVLNRREFQDDAIHNIRSPNPGDGSGPSVGDVRGMLGKDSN